MSKPITINPKVSFGRPCPTGTGIHYTALSSRFQAGESAASIAEDYHIAIEQVEAAIRYKMGTKRQREKLLERV